MDYRGWQYVKRRRDLAYSDYKKGMGTVYVAVLKVTPEISLLKIGCTGGDAKSRLTSGYSLANLREVAQSPFHYNYNENEYLLHKYFEKYRLPPKPNKGNKPELFNMSIKYFFKYMPDLLYATEMKDVYPIPLEHYNIPLYVTCQSEVNETEGGKFELIHFGKEG